MRRWTAAPPFSNVTFCPIWCLWINLKGLNKCLLAKKTFLVNKSTMAGNQSFSNFFRTSLVLILNYEVKNRKVANI